MNYRSTKLITALFVFNLFNLTRLHAVVPTGLSGLHANGQTFLWWKKIPGEGVHYHVYRSTNPIASGSQLPGSDYLGYVDDEVAVNFALTKHDGITKYYVIDSNAVVLDSTMGLFVATTFQPGSYYYAVTTTIGTTTNNAINVGKNSMAVPVVETVGIPQPILQEIRLITNKQVEIYASFTSSKTASGAFIFKSGFCANDFSFFRNGATKRQPMRVNFHPGGEDFLKDITEIIGSEVNLGIEDRFPNDWTSSWWGTNQNFDIYDQFNNLDPPTSGINYNYTQERIVATFEWAIKNLPVDSNRIYLDATSFGSCGAYFLAMLYPERIAAIKITGGAFDMGFTNDWNPNCSLNEGKKNRIDGDTKFGTVQSDLMTNLGYATYNVMNGGWLAHEFRENVTSLI